MQPELLIISADPALRELAVREATLVQLPVHSFDSARAAVRHLARPGNREPAAADGDPILLVDARTPNLGRLRETGSELPQGTRAYVLRANAREPVPSHAEWIDGLTLEADLPRPESPAQMRALLDRISAGRRSAHPADAPIEGLDALIGRSVAFRVALENAMRMAADRDAPVLLCGEPGTGKRLFARAIHSESGRGEKRLLEIDCREVGSDDDRLHVFSLRETDGGPTGSAPDGDGIGEGGGVLLAHVDALGRDDQQRILAYLDAHKLWRIQQLCRPRHDLRIYATTERDLERDARAATFHPELYERLAPQRIDLPALRERPSDALLLAEHFLSGWRHDQQRSVMRLARPARERLLEYDWPGNVTELREVMRRALSRAGDSWEIRAEHLDGLLAAQARPSRPRTARPPLPHAAARGTQARPGGGTYGPARRPAPRPGAGSPGQREAPAGAPQDVLAHPSTQQAYVGGEKDQILVHLPEGGVGFEELEKAILLAALERTSGNVVRAAKLLRMGRGSLRYRLEKYELVEPKRRASRPASRRSDERRDGSGLRRAS
ncbi:MAG: hypothetical protein GF330_07885 [Candidatus Eisenbacteria bacterium]|nr:hypothetical protein [Candidatus Eisenbacteria bacterium]